MLQDNSQNLDKFKTWQGCLDHHGIGMIRIIINNSVGHNFKVANLKSSDFMCTTCAMLKIILRLSHLKIINEPLIFIIFRNMYVDYSTIRSYSIPIMV